jgi:hypothetical protein
MTTYSFFKKSKKPDQNIEILMPTSASYILHTALHGVNVEDLKLYMVAQVTKIC